MFGVFDRGETGEGIAIIPESLWELGLGLSFTFKGFRPSPILTGDSRWVRAEATPTPARG
jgi:hypothetical protein